MSDGERWQRVLLQGTFIFLAVLLSVSAVAWVLQKVLVRQALALEAETFVEAYQVDPAYPLPRTRNLVGYLVDRHGLGSRPEVLRDLPPGFHARVPMPAHERPLPVYIEDFGGGRLYLVFTGYNVDRLIGLFGLVPVTLLLIIVYATSWIAYKLSLRAVSPVLRIARRLRDSSPAQPIPQLPTHGLKGETRELVLAMDEYKQRLEELVERERRFSSDVSHELRTPITIIDGAAQFLEAESELSDKGRGRARMIRRACKDISELIDAFLILGREPKRLSETDAVDVADVAEAELGKLAALLDGKSLEMKLEASAPLRLPVHRKVIEIILSNLCRNAINYSEQGVIRVKVDRDGIRVEDSGCGIDEALIPHIFDRHVRGRGVQKAGEGIGLNIVKRLCDLYGWEIRVANREGAGVVVSIRMV